MRARRPAERWLGNRRFFLSTPTKLPAPLLIAFHGRAQEVDGTQGEVLGIERDFVAMSGLVESCLDHGMSVAFFEGERRRGMGRGRDWDFSADEMDRDAWPGDNDNADVRYVNAVVTRLGEQDVHDGRIVVAGFSNGGSFAPYAAERLRGLVRGLAIHSGGIKKPLDGDGPGVRCPVVVLCERGGPLDVTKRMRLKMAQRIEQIYLGAGCPVSSSYKKDTHRWRKEENDWILSTLGF